MRLAQITLLTAALGLIVLQQPTRAQYPRARELAAAGLYARSMNRGGYSGGFGGGMPSGGYNAMNSSAAMGPYGGSGMGGQYRQGGYRHYGVHYPPGGYENNGVQYQAGARSGSYTTRRSATVNYGAASYGGGTNGAGRYGAVGYAPGARSALGTSYLSAATLSGLAAAAWSGYGGNYFTPQWFAGYPNAWTASAYTTPAVTTPATWDAVAGYAGYPQQPMYYDYGANVVAQPDAMYVNGDPVGTPKQYAAQAAKLAAAGRNAKGGARGAWQPLGVFAIVADEQTPPNEYFQLAINRQGVLRGNYYNTELNRTEPIAGSVDPKTLRAAWTVGQAKAPVFEAGIANLTKDATTMLVYGADGRPQQVALARMPAPDAPDNSQQGGR